MPCVLCSNLLTLYPCKANNKDELLESIPVGKFTSEESLQLLFNLMSGCPCEACLVNSKCTTACNPFKTNIKRKLNKRFLQIIELTENTK